MSGGPLLNLGRIETFPVEEQIDALNLLRGVSEILEKTGSIEFEEKPWGVRVFLTDGGSDQNWETVNALENNSRFWIRSWRQSMFIGMKDDKRVLRHEFHLVFSERTIGAN